MRTPTLLALVLAAAAPAQTVLPPFNSAYSGVDFGVIPGTGSYGGITFQRDDPNVLLVAAYASRRVIAVQLRRDAQGYITGFGSYSVVATVGGTDGGLAYGPGNVLFHTWYGPNRLCQIKPGSAADDRVIDLTPLGVSNGVGSCQLVPAGRAGAGRLKLATYHSSQWYDVGLAADGNGTYSITTVSPAVQLAGGPEGILYPPVGIPMLDGANHVLVAAWNGPGVVVYDTDGNGDPIPATARTVLVGVSGPGGGAVDPVTGDMLFTGGGGHLVAIRRVASCGSAVAYGAGTPGLRGVPTLQGSGCARIGEAFALDVGSGRPSAYGVLFTGSEFRDIPVLGVRVLTNATFATPHLLDAAGTFHAALPVPLRPEIAYQHVYFQAVYLDAAATQGISASRGLDVQIR